MGGISWHRTENKHQPGNYPKRRKKMTESKVPDVQVPRFLHCSSLQDPQEREYVLHTQKPRFLAVLVEDEEKEADALEIVSWFDDVPADDFTIARLQRAVTDWFAVEVEKEADLFLEDEDL
jgi:hypothetical protein